jgi:site-specific DNA recombinase
MTTKPRTVGYVRASTEDQTITLEAQRERIAAYCAMRGFELIEVLVDAGVSGGIALAERREGGRLAAVLKARKARHVVALKLDRLFRDAADALTQTRAWDRAGIALHLVDMGGAAVDTSSAMGRMMLTMLAGFAEFERALVAERTSAALRHKASKGEYIGGEAPYGFRLAAGVLLQDPAEQEVLRTVRDYRTAGLSFRAIAARLAAAGRLTRTGRPFDPTQIRRMVA